MKFRVGDTVKITAGKDKGKQGKILRVDAVAEQVVVEGMNLFVKHIKKQGERSGQRVLRERPLPTGNIAIVNPKTKRVDRVGYQVKKDGTKVRIFKKTGEVIETNAAKKK